MRYLMGPMVDGPLPWRRALKTLLKNLGNPALILRNLLTGDWEKRITVFTVMQDHDHHIGMHYRRVWWILFRHRGIVGNELASYLPVAQARDP